jgi:hypothetical protein
MTVIYIYIYIYIYIFSCLPFFFLSILFHLAGCYNCLCKLTGQALDTLGNTKWKVNKMVLSVVDRLWAGGGRLADLVDRNDVSSFVSFLCF